MRMSDLGKRPWDWHHEDMTHEEWVSNDIAGSQARIRAEQAEWDRRYAAAKRSLPRWKRVLHALGVDVSLPPDWLDPRFERRSVDREDPDAPPADLANPVSRDAVSVTATGRAGRRPLPPALLPKPGLYPVRRQGGRVDWSAIHPLLSLPQQTRKSK